MIYFVVFSVINLSRFRLSWNVPTKQNATRVFHVISWRNAIIICCCCILGNHNLQELSTCILLLCISCILYGIVSRFFFVCVNLCSTSLKKILSIVVNAKLEFRSALLFVVFELHPVFTILQTETFKQKMIILHFLTCLIPFIITRTTHESYTVIVKMTEL